MRSRRDEYHFDPGLQDSPLPPEYGWAPIVLSAFGLDPLGSDFLAGGGSPDPSPAPSAPLDVPAPPPAGPSPAFVDHVMDWQDEDLESAMREITGVAEGDIWLHDVWEMTSLDLEGWPIQRIDALRGMTGLTYPGLGWNYNLRDISVLEGLPNLTEAVLEGTDFEGWSPT